MFTEQEIGFLPGLYANRSRRGSKQRWIDGDFVRFPDGVPESTGGWSAPAISGDVSIDGIARASLSYRPSTQLARYLVVASEKGVYRFDGSTLADISPSGMADGRADAIVGGGYGAGLYGEDDFGGVRVVVGSVFGASSWSLDLFGDVVIACYDYDSVIYDYDIEDGDTELQVVTGTNIPTANAIAVSDERHLFAFGANDDPTLVLWSDREDYGEFTISATTRAGGVQLQNTSPFLYGQRTRGAMLGWTGTEVFAFFPLANSIVYSFERVGTNCGAAGKQAVCVVTDASGESAIWMGLNSFFIFEGYVRELECELHDYVFDDINLVQRSKFTARQNSEFNEVWFFYVSASATEIDRAVVYNYVTGVWSKASLIRTTWCDAGIFDKPLAVDVSGTIFEHEVGDDDENGDPIGSWIKSHPMMIGAGERFADIDRMWVDLAPGSDPITVTISTRNSPSGNETSYGPYNFALGDEKIDLAISAREMSFRFDGTAGYWELGVPSISRQVSSGR